MAKQGRLLVKIRGNTAAFASSGRRMGVSGSGAREVLTLKPEVEGDPALAQGASATWFSVDRTQRFDNAWDEAHDVLRNGKRIAGDVGFETLAVEPDIEQSWPYVADERRARGVLDGRFNDQSSADGQASLKGRNAWHLGDDFSQFAAARARVGNDQHNILVAHLDTGYDPDHKTLPAGIRLALQRSTIPGEAKGDAVDRAPSRSATANRGHGLGTLGILAGGDVPTGTSGWESFPGGPIGAAPGVSIIPIRIADWVVRFSTGTLVEGIHYAVSSEAHVLSLSMGGLSSAALVDAVNLAYDSGVTMVAAAGNHYSQMPFPSSIVFPARYRRVIAACGVMADGAAYHGLRRGAMQGNHGPDQKMATALGAYTPNLPWAEIDSVNLVDMDGAGTSSATPQIAAAAALWLAMHWKTVSKYSGWQRVEAVRWALFSTAAKSTAKMGREETFKTIGNGIVRALDALQSLPVPVSQLRASPASLDSWSWLDLLFNGQVSLDDEVRRQRMLRLELTQIAQLNAKVDRIATEIEAQDTPPSAPSVARYLDAVLDEGKPSSALRVFLEQRLGRTAIPVSRPVQERAAAPRVVRKPYAPPPPARRLRIYALDPSIGKELATASVHQATVRVPWDDEPLSSPLLPGPVGEYVEIVDVDPASRRIYDPVDLNAKQLLAQDGLAPSEGDPQFHQQMVYAVAMTTIKNFERALGRRALWAPCWDEDKKKYVEVRRLRIYPHALRTANAYYSPEKVALLFGYFAAEGEQLNSSSAGSMVFTCLSSDIIAHEMSHALLDGLHRRFQEASNPDVPAFHEAFSDIVALFQHFELTELVAFEIGKTRGLVTASNLLGGLAKQFGEGSGRAGPLRNYLDAAGAELDYKTTMSPHERGSILVFAVYDAFLAIVAKRIADLTHLATGGSGILPEGALHPGLVDGLTQQVTKTAGQVLNMCIRALDYCPPVDITFGEYLRAIITADVDLFPDDPMSYRLAFMQAFRKWESLPKDVRTVSAETLSWSGPADDALDRAFTARLIDGLDLGWNQKLDRSTIFKLNEKNRWKLWNKLDAAFGRFPRLLAQFGLMDKVPRYSNDGRVQRPVRPKRSDTTFDVHGVRPTRRVDEDGTFRTEIVAVIQQRVPMRSDGTLALDGITDDDGPFTWFRGGATVIIDPTDDAECIRFSIIKNTGSRTRQAAQRNTQLGVGNTSSLRSLYFGGDSSEPFAMLHADHDDEEHGHA